MNKKFYLWAISVCIFSSISVTTTTAFAEATTINTSNNIVCAVIDAVACVDNEACVQGTSKDFDLPEFAILDTKKKEMRAAFESGHKAISAVKTMETSDDHLILQGIEKGRGWNIAVNTKNGKMSGALVGDGLSFLIFGHCTAL